MTRASLLSIAGKVNFYAPVPRNWATMAGEVACARTGNRPWRRRW